MDSGRTFSENILDDIVHTICGMANIDPGRDSYIYVGVTDKDADARRVKQLDGIDPVDFEGRKIVGIGREVKIAGLGLDGHVMKIKG